MLYEIAVVEHVDRRVYVEAENIREALERARENYKNEEYSFNAKDPFLVEFVCPDDTEFNILELEIRTESN